LAVSRLYPLGPALDKGAEWNSSKDSGFRRRAIKLKALPGHRPGVLGSGIGDPIKEGAAGYLIKPKGRFALLMKIGDPSLQPGHPDPRRSSLGP